MYDIYSEEGIKGNNAERHSNTQAMFEHLFGMNDNEDGQGQEIKITPTYEANELDLEDFYEGRIVTKQSLKKS